MPALAGVLLRDGRSAGARVTEMLRASPHRGSELTVEVAGSIAVGVCDVRAGAQSSTAARHGSIAAFVGRLDNAADLSAELRQALAPDSTPAELVLASFERWGRDAPSRFRGEFAAAIGIGSQLMVLRDQLGLRALFDRDDAQGCFVASEPKQVVAGARIAHRPALDVVEQLFYGNPVDERATAIEGVGRLPKGTVLTVSGERVTAWRYWRPEDLLETQLLSEAEIQERFDDLMDQAVTRTFFDETVVSLSGGIDSPAIAAYAAPRHLQRYGRPLPALSRLYPDQPSVDERAYIELVAGELRLPLHTYHHRSRVFDGLEDWVRLLECPVPNWSGSDLDEHLAQAKAIGATTVLTGELAEFVVDAAEHLDSYLLARARLRAFARRAAQRRVAGQGLALIARRSAAPFLPGHLAAWAVARTGRGRFARLPDWVDRSRLEAGRDYQVVGPANRWRHNQLRAFRGAGWSVEGEEVRQDVLGVRMRMPWGDVDLWELFLSLRAEVKYPSLEHKPLARRLLRGRVPDPILDRADKTVFNDAVLAAIDYDELRRRVLDPEVEIPGVDYHKLARSLDRQQLDVPGYVWARDLAVVHAFLGMWRPSDEPASAATGGSGR